MWKETARGAWPDAAFAAPVSPAALTDAERRLGCGLPGELTGLLRETDGLVGPYGVDAVWPLERVVEQNLYFRSDRSFAELYMPFDALLFFGDNGGGDQFAFVRTPRRPDVFVWEHEDDSRRWAARDLRDYLERSLGADGDDWYR
ncbi:SMI1/KNR4 family protein [Streptomyces rimosus]|uniref:SMI1/KNR4 family protein n=1 Tax=Streptomyces rimosus TaxID=1927 RepID=UPI0004CAF7C7|nr:SMI1/KNR4 family protein [Streptomyces rimosus]